MFAAAMTVQMLMSMTSLWTITLHSIANCVGVAILATGIQWRQVGSYMNGDDICLI
jgi:hypothetical protein